MKKPLTKRQKELLKIIYEYIKSTGFPPTFEEMRERLKVVSNQSILDLLEKLKEAGAIRREESGARSIAILPFGYREIGEPALAPFIGATSSGAFAETIEITSEWQTISKEIAEPKENIFLLKVSGDSMINAGIENEDVVIVREQKEFVSGDIVFAQFGNESTIKRFISEDKAPYVYLKPENPNHENILFTDEVEMKGKVISVLKGDLWKPIK